MHPAAVLLGLCRALSSFCYLPGEKGCLLKSLRKHRSTSTNVEKLVIIAIWNVSCKL